MATVAQRLQSERLKYEGMLPDEIIVFRTWLKLHEKDYDRFDFNVRTGKGEDPGPSFPDNTRQMAVKITQLRIDAVAWRQNVPTIIEVKRRAGPSNVGQLLTYSVTWREANRGTPRPQLLLICNTFSPEILSTLKEVGIQLEVVQADFSELATPKRRFPRLRS